MNYSDLTLEKDTFYFLCSAGLGDTFLVCSVKEPLQKMLGGKIRFLIKKSHEIVFLLFNCGDYTIIDDFSDIDFQAVSDECAVPSKSKVFVAHPHAHGELWSFFEPIFYHRSETPFLPWFLKFLGLPADTPLEPIKYIPPVPTDLLETIGAPIEKIVLFSPEANSVPPVDAQIWEEKAKELQAEGFTVVSNVILKDNAVKGTLFVPMTVEQAVALAFHCHAVYSLRSGFCDLIHPVGNRLTVFYPSYASLWIYSLNKMFGGTQINEELHLPSLKSRNAAQNLPSLKSQKAAQKEKWKIFFFKIIHFRACRKDGALTRVKFLGIPFLSLKQKGNIVRVRLLGIPFMRIKKVR